MKILRRLLQYLNKLFQKHNKKRNESEVVRKSKLIKENKNEENEIIDKNPAHEEIIDLIEAEQDSLSDVEIGDIIWGKRYVDEIEKSRIPVGHQEGPYIVVDKSECGLICVKGSSVIPKTEHLDNYFYIPFNDYALDKNTYFSVMKFHVIDNNSFCYKIDSLINEDKILLYRKVKSKKNNYYCFNGEKKKCNIDFIEGDLISVKGTIYLIMNMINNKMLCVRVNIKGNNLQVNDIRYLDYLNLFQFDADDNPKYIGTISSTLLAYALKREKEYIENYKNQTITQRGSVILKNNELSYIYGEEGQKWLIFEIHQNKYDLFDKIKIGTKTFYTEYNKKNIDKKEEFMTIALAFPEEMEYISSQRKSYKYRIQKENNCKGNTLFKK